MEDVPPFSDEFIDALDQRFSQRPIHPTTPLPQIMYQAGIRSVIDYLRTIQRERMKRSLELE